MWRSVVKYVRLLFVGCLLLLLLFLCNNEELGTLLPSTIPMPRSLDVQGARNKSITDGRRTQTQEQIIKGLVVSPVYPQHVIYNRVPKCASTSTVNMCTRMSVANHFTLDNLQVIRNLHKHSQQRKLVSFITNRSGSHHLYFDHIRYINFSRFGIQEPSWINIVREPVKRFISHFYFFKPSQSLEECVKKTFCKFKIGKLQIRSMVSYFCGYNVPCGQEGSLEALHIAKQMVEKRFVVVGLQEDLNNTFFLLESLLPNFFRGATKLTLHTLNALPSKPPVSDLAIARLEQRLRVDIEFYEYLKQRFYTQLGIVKNQH